MPIRIMINFIPVLFGATTLSITTLNIAIYKIQDNDTQNDVIAFAK